jgi:integrase
MAHVQKRQRTSKDGTPGAVLWCLRYVNPETGRERTETFRLKRDAERRLTEVEASKLAGSYVDPRAGQVTVSAWAERWFDVQVQLKPTTRARYRSILDVHVIPRWGTIELAKVRHADVQKWVAELSSERSAATVRKVHRVFSQVLGSAVKDGRLVRNVAEGVALPRVHSKERLYLTHEQVAELADACAAVPVNKYSSTTKADRAAYRLLVLFLAYTGLRWGELAGLRVGRLDLMRRRASIVETFVVVDGHMVPSGPKNHERRDVPVPRFLIDELAAHVAGQPSDALVFGGEKAGTPMRSRTFQRAVLDQAAIAVGLDGFTPHMLRHTAASLAIAAGADVKVVQQMLGHKSATMTLDLYGHLFPDRLDTVADAMDTARTVALEAAAGAETGRRRDTGSVVTLRRK